MTVLLINHIRPPSWPEISYSIIHLLLGDSFSSHSERRKIPTHFLLSIVFLISQFHGSERSRFKKYFGIMERIVYVICTLLVQEADIHPSIHPSTVQMP